MMYLLGLVISFTAGYLIIRWLTAGKLHPVLHILLSVVLGLGLAGTTAFYTHILLNQSNRFLPVAIVLIAIAVALLTQRGRILKEIASSLKNASRNDIGWGLLILGALGIPLAISGHYYPLGGWDAWSCWNLKAKFIFLGQENWKDMLTPELWRSNTHYPLLWPLINVWFFDLGGQFNQTIPMFNSILFALLTASILLFTLREFTGRLWTSLLAAVIITALPFNITLYTSQYSDALLGLLLLSAFVSWLLAEKYQLPKLKNLSMIFLGMLSFTKNEGLMLAGIAFLLILWYERAHKKELPALAGSFLLAALPTVIFTLFLAPKNEAFINGLLSTEKPITWERLGSILTYPWFEFISNKWNGFWVLVLGGILWGRKKLWQSTHGVIAATLILYLTVVLSYYSVNTFFEINWWLSTTLSRILFALIPTITLWIGLAL